MKLLRSGLVVLYAWAVADVELLIFSVLLGMKIIIDTNVR